MKIITSFFLILFLTFLSTPTLVTLIVKSCDSSVFYSFAEEENLNDLKDIKADFSKIIDYPFLNFKTAYNSKIVSENSFNHDFILDEIFSPPPEFI